MICPKCGIHVNDGAPQCPQCKAVMPGQDPQREGQAPPLVVVEGKRNRTGNAGGAGKRPPKTEYVNARVYDAGPQNNIAKILAIVAYLSPIGLIISLLVGNSRDKFLRFHQNQALVVMLFGILSYIPRIGLVWGLFIVVCWILGISGAAQDKTRRVPLIGVITLIR